MFKKLFSVLLIVSIILSSAPIGELINTDYSKFKVGSPRISMSKAIDSINESFSCEAKAATNTVADATSQKVTRLTAVSLPTQVAVNAAAEVKLYVYPENANNKEIRWTSSNEEIATVTAIATDERSYATASIRGIASGTCTITYEATDGSGITGSFLLFVTPLVSSISFDKTDIVIYVGSRDEIKITAICQPINAENQRLSWISSDEDVATVADGKIIVHATGTCTITAVAQDGSGVTKTANLTVLGKAKSINISDAPAKIKTGDKVDFDCTVETNQGRIYYVKDWSVDKKELAEISEDGILTALLPGEVTVTAKYFDGTTATKTITIECSHEKTVFYPEKSSTCTKTGLTEGSRCSICNAVLVKQETIPKKEHTNKTTITKATLTKNGSTVTKCTVCGKISKTVTIAYPKTISLSATSFAYTGKAIKPTVTVKDSKGNKISSLNYTVKYASGRKNAGEYTVTVTFKGNYYSGSKKLSFKIVPKCTSISSVSAASCAFTVNWKKQSSQTTGYQLQYSTSSGFSSAKTVTVKKNTTVSHTVSKLKGNTKYYVRVRTYKTVDGENYYSDWSAKKSVTTKPAVGITLKSSSETLYTGGTKTLSYTSYPTKATVTWKSSNTSVAKVSSHGKVTAVKKGTAMITASFKNGGKTYKDTCKITVKTPSIKLNKTSASVTVKSSITLSAKVAPSSASVKWKSSNTSVAKVSSSGKVTGVKAGTATITASFSYGGKTYKATCKVKVISTIESNLKEVKNYIKKHGEIYYTYYDEEDDIDYTCFIELEKDNSLTFTEMCTVEDDLTSWIFMNYDYGYKKVTIEGSADYFDEDILWCEATEPVKLLSKYYEPEFEVTDYNPFILTEYECEELAVATFNSGMIDWNIALISIFGFGLKDIGLS